MKKLKIIKLVVLCSFLFVTMLSWLSCTATDTDATMSTFTANNSGTMLVKQKTAKLFGENNFKIRSMEYLYNLDDSNDYIRKKDIQYGNFTKIIFRVTNCSKNYYFIFRRVN